MPNTMLSPPECIQMGSDDIHFDVSLIVKDKVTRQCPQTTSFEEKGEPKQIRTGVLLLISLTPYRQAKPADNTETLPNQRSQYSTCVSLSVNSYALLQWFLVPSRLTELFISNFFSSKTGGQRADSWVRMESQQQGTVTLSVDTTTPSIWRPPAQMPV